MVGRSAELFNWSIDTVTVILPSTIFISQEHSVLPYFSLIGQNESDSSSADEGQSNEKHHTSTTVLGCLTGSSLVTLLYGLQLLTYAQTSHKSFLRATTKVATDVPRLEVLK